MKTNLVAVMLLSGAIAGYSQLTSQSSKPVPSDTAYSVVERGANHRVWQKISYELGPNGQPVPRIHRYTELATGMNYKDANGQWQESKELIESYPGGAIAQQGQYQVIFANDLNSYGAIDMQTPDGKRLRSNILGLMYVDTSTGDTVMFAHLQDSTGQMISPNQVLYINAFSEIKADVRYTYRKGGFEQDVILREQPPTPESYGLNPDTTVLEVVTEFLNPPAAKIAERTDGTSDEVDDTVSWGATTIGRGKAFALNGRSSGFRARVPVDKRYVSIQGRNFLIERVRMKEIQPQLIGLPLQSSIHKDKPMMASKAPAFPQTPLVRTDAKPMKLAAATPPDRGYVLDYATINSARTNFTFQGDTTYYVSGEYTLSGTTTVEGGTVIKLNGSGQIDIDQNGDLDCKTGSYRPAVFTSKNDNTVGETISGSSGVPTTGDVFVAIDVLTTNGVVHDLHFRYCTCGILHDWGSTQGWMDVWDCQFAEADVAVYGYNVGLHNVLIGGAANWDPAVYVEGPSFVAENVTADYAPGFGFVEPDYYGATLAMTNCLITRQPLVYDGNGYTLSTNATVCLPSPSSPVYQVVGAANYYLTNGSSYRDVGTTNISADMLVDLQSKTTYPPLVYSNTTIPTATTFSVQAQRDTDTPDLGYHYDPLDYVFGGVSTYSNVIFAAGTAVGYFELPGSGGPGYGISMYDKVVLAFNGTADQPCVFTRYSTVQEGGNGLWKDKGWLAGIAAKSLSGGYYMNPTNAAEVRPNFTRHTSLANDGNIYREYNALIKIVARNSEFRGSMGWYWAYYSLTNCLFDRSFFGIGGGNVAIFSMRNCTMHGGTLSLSKYGQTWPVWIENCAFDGATLSVDDNSGGNTNITYCDFNAFLTNGNRLPMHGLHDITNVLSFNWQSSYLGDYYLPTDSALIDKGSLTADQLGLYHFTTQTSQEKETNSVVDIGYHYVATDSSGNPIDTDGDGVPDYLEDTNGNGVFDAGDLSDWLLNAYNGLSAAFRLQVFTPLK